MLSEIVCRILVALLSSDFCAPNTSATGKGPEISNVVRRHSSFMFDMNDVGRLVLLRGTKDSVNNAAMGVDELQWFDIT